MNIRIVSDLTLDPVVKKLRAQAEHNISFHYADNVELALITEAEALLQQDLLIIHIDLYFSANLPQYHSMLHTLLERYREYGGYILLPSQLLPYPSGPIQPFGAQPLSPELLAQISASKNIAFYPWLEKLAAIGTAKAYHFGLGHLYQMPYTNEAQRGLEAVWGEWIAAFSRADKKCIITDLDNTLWGGILGEDGVEDIKVDKNADGILYLHFQEFLKQKKEEGFLLCICSKNNEEDVMELFAKRKMPLTLDDFIIRKMNWQDKYLNLQEIAAELNIGTDSFVLIDDSDFEAGAIQNLMPEVTVFQFKPDYAAFRAMAANPVFRKRAILAEDRQKTASYQAEQQRKAAATQTDKLEDFIQSLGIKATFYFNEAAQLERLSQLTGKTNQFNFNKEALSANALSDFIAEGNTIISASVEDKFGDYGIIGLMLVERRGGEAFLKNFLMSCRALGRSIEQQFLETLRDWLDKQGMKLIGIAFNKTEKNKPAELFLPELEQTFSLRS